MSMKKLKIPLQVFSLALIGCMLCACQTDNALSQTTQPEKSPQQILEEQPIDDTHDAFLVDTGGELGTLLVTAELAMENKDEFGTRDIAFSVWNPADMEQPIQTFSEEFMMGVAPEFHHVVDANLTAFKILGISFSWETSLIIVTIGCGMRNIGNSNTVRLFQKYHRPYLTRSGKWSLAGRVVAEQAMVSLLSTVGRMGNWYVYGELSPSLHGKNQALSVCRIGLMENFNRSITRSFLGLVRNWKGRKHGGRHSINGSIWTITARQRRKISCGQEKILENIMVYSISKYVCAYNFVLF